MVVTSIDDKAQHKWIAYAACLLLGFSFAFGGSSRDHEFRLLAVELAALPLLVMALTQIVETGTWRSHRLLLGLLSAILLLPLAQLVPLPPSLWQALPGRDAIEVSRAVSGAQPGWVTMSLTPDRTWSAWFALLPPAAVLLSALLLSRQAQGRLVQILVIGCVCSLALGMVQVASGGADWSYPWDWTNRGWMAGLFANRNHLATLCLMALPFAILTFSRGLGAGRSGPLDVWFGATLTVVLVVALGVIKSRAGVVIAGPVVVLSLLAAWRANGARRLSAAWVGLVAVLGAGILAVTTFALPPLMERFDQDASEEGRFREWPTVVDAVQVYAPAGSGMGSFDAVHRSVEPLQRLRPTYFNQAHNDYLEIWLEAGLIGLLLVTVFVAWLGAATWRAWRATRQTMDGLGLAASTAVLAVMAGSVVDYPLRTETIAVAFALCCAILERSGDVQSPTCRRRDASNGRAVRSAQPSN